MLVSPEVPGYQVSACLPSANESGNCFGSFQGDKKDMQVQNNSFIGAKNNDISGDLNTVAFIAPQLLNLRAREGRS